MKWGKPQGKDLPTTTQQAHTCAQQLKKQGDKKNVTNPFRIATPSHGAKVFP